MEKPKFETPDMVAGNIEKIGALFPRCHYGDAAQVLVPESDRPG